MQAVILAGGKSSRLKYVSGNICKPLMSLFDIPILEHQIKLLLHHNITDIILAISYDAKNIISYFENGSCWGANISYSVEQEPLGTAGAVKNVHRMLDDTFIVMSGDIITDFDLTYAVNRHKSSSSIFTILTSRADDPIEYGIIDSVDGIITRFIEKPRDSEIFTDVVNSGVYIVEKEVLNLISYREECDFAFHLFPELIHNKEKFSAFEAPGYWCDAGNSFGYRKAHFDALAGKLRLEVNKTSFRSDVCFGMDFSVDKTAKTISPFHIGDRVRIGANAVIGPNVILGNDCVIEDNAFISNSVIGHDSVVGSFGKVINSVLGGPYNIESNEHINASIRLENTEYTKPSTVSRLINRVNLELEKEIIQRRSKLSKEQLT